MEAKNQLGNAPSNQIANAAHGRINSPAESAMGVVSGGKTTTGDGVASSSESGTRGDITSRLRNGPSSADAAERSFLLVRKGPKI